MCSTPPTRTTSAAPIAISPAPAVVAVSAPAHMRSTANPGTELRQPGEQRDVASQRQALVADLRGRGEDDVVDPLLRELRVAPQHLADDLHGHVVGPRPGEEAVRRGAAEGRAHAVHVDDLAKLSHGRDDTSVAMGGWEERAVRARERYEDGLARLPDEPDERQRQLTRMGNAAWAAGLAHLMSGDADESREWLLRAADTYRQSWTDAPAGSWGRPIGAMKSRLIAGDAAGAREDAGWALAAGAATSESPIGRYAATLALLVLGEDARGRVACRDARRATAPIPSAVSASLTALAAGDQAAYEAGDRRTGRGLREP